MVAETEPSAKPWSEIDRKSLKVGKNVEVEWDFSSCCLSLKCFL